MFITTNTILDKYIHTYTLEYRKKKRQKDTQTDNIDAQIKEKRYVNLPLLTS